MNYMSKAKVLLGLCAVLTFAGCASTPEPHGLQPGVWEMQAADGAVVDVKISRLQGSEYYFDAGTHPISGVYGLESSAVSMVKPDNPRMKEYVWRLREDRSLVLVREPAIELSGRRLISSTLIGPR